ncbi:putative 1-deoxy-D-xylulose-5-phosphate synthase, chloroplastic, partial [Cucurbita argyrosperma subsp. argyrosperma]
MCAQQAKYRYVLHNAAVTVTNSNGCPTKVELPAKARPTGKGVQRCANCLVGPYSHIWAVCRVYGTGFEPPLVSSPLLSGLRTGLWNPINHGSPRDQMEEAGLSAGHIAGTVLTLLGRSKEALSVQISVSRKPSS